MDSSNIKTIRLDFPDGEFVEYRTDAPTMSHFGNYEWRGRTDRVTTLRNPTDFQKAMLDLDVAQREHGGIITEGGNNSFLPEDEIHF